jgi:hypothetical protein
MSSSRVLGLYTSSSNLIDQSGAIFSKRGKVILIEAQFRFEGTITYVHL